MQKLIAGIGILGLLALTVPVLAANEATVSATVTVEKISITVDPNAVDYGTLAFGETAISSTFTATNDGNVAEDFGVRGTDATFTGGTWTLVTATPTTNQFSHSVTGVTPAITEQFLTGTSASWASGVAANGGTQTFTSKIYMPPAGSDGSGEVASTSIILLATKS